MVHERLEDSVPAPVELHIEVEAHIRRSVKSLTRGGGGGREEEEGSSVPHGARANGDWIKWPVQRIFGVDLSWYSFQDRHKKFAF